MKRIMCFFVLLSSVIVNRNVSDNSYGQYVNKSYIVMDANSNKVIEGKEINLVRSVASVSKIMTAIVAIENGDLDREVTITNEDIDTYGSSIYLQKGDKLTILDLLYGLMLRSGNDAANAISRVVGNGNDNFINMMNDKASEIGMKNSTFTNPSGLDVNETGNLSTSYDLALLMSYALKNETFLKISGAKDYKSNKGVWGNKNKLLRNYKYTIAGKTGFTYKAKRTLVSASRKEDTTLVVVTLDCGNDFNFHKFLYERNFEKYETINILESGINVFEEYLVTCNKDISIFIEKSKKETYSLLYSIKEGGVDIYLEDGSSKIEIGNCSVSINKKEYKLNLLEKIKNLFK